MNLPRWMITIIWAGRFLLLHFWYVYYHEQPVVKRSLIACFMCWNFIIIFDGLVGLDTIKENLSRFFICGSKFALKFNIGQKTKVSYSPLFIRKLGENFRSWLECCALNFDNVMKNCGIVTKHSWLFASIRALIILLVSFYYYY